ncbi:MAG: glycosyltransferase, partial [Endomicrobiales bacterium]
MKVLVEGRVLGRKQITGVERYATQLIRALKQQGLNVETETPSSDNRYLRHVWEHVRLPLKAGGYDILFCPANLAPFWKPKRCKYVVTVHDLSFKIIKDAYNASYRYYYEIMTGRLMRLADRIITDSEYEKDVLGTFFPEYRDKVNVIYPGVEERFKVPE